MGRVCSFVNHKAVESGVVSDGGAPLRHQHPMTPNVAPDNAVGTNRIFDVGNLRAGTGSQLARGGTGTGLAWARAAIIGNHSIQCHCGPMIDEFIGHLVNEAPRPKGRGFFQNNFSCS